MKSPHYWQKEVEENEVSELIKNYYHKVIKSVIFQIREVTSLFELLSISILALMKFVYDKRGTLFFC